MTTLDSFETALLARLREEVAVPRRRRRAAGAPIRAAAAGLASAVGLGVVLWPEAAWAVDGEANGDVTVTIRRFDDVAGLERALADQGVDAVVRLVDAREVTEPPVATPACDAISGFRASIGGGEATYVIPAAGVVTDAVLHVEHGGDIGDGAQEVEHKSWIALWWEGGPCAG